MNFNKKNISILKKYPSRRIFRLRGSFTIEAAFVIPFILAVVVSFINITFFCHDKAVLSYLGERACLVAANVRDGEDICQKAKEVFEQEAKEQLMGKWEFMTEVYIEGDCVELNSSAVSLFWKTEIKARVKLP